MMANDTRADVRIVNLLGLHARPAGLFVRESNRYAADIFVSRDGVEVNGKSIMGVMMLAAEHGVTLTIRAEGEDAEEAVENLVALVERGFDEDDEGQPVPRGGPVNEG